MRGNKNWPLAKRSELLRRSQLTLRAIGGHSVLALAALFEQSERATERIRRCLALVTGHAVDFELEMQVLRIGLFGVPVQPDHRIRCHRLRNAFDLLSLPQTQPW